MVSRVGRIITVLGVLSLLVGAEAVTGGTALASGSTKVTNCANQGGGPHHSVTCVGTINGNNVTVTISNVRVLDNNELSQLVQLENNIFVSVANLDVQTQLNQIAVDTVTILENVFNI